MLKIVNANGRTLSLAPGTVIPVERNNPLFNDDDVFLQDVSYSFNVPLSENSKCFFELGHLVETSNERYLMRDLALYASGTRMIRGNIRYSVRKEGFEVNLEPNFAAINALIKNIRLTEIRTEDAEYGFTQSTFEARMLDTCVNPDKYNYIYFPVYNPEWVPEAGPGEIRPFVNYYDTATNTFKAHVPFGTPIGAQSPYFKLSYIIKQLAAYLGFTATGSYFTDESTKNRCIYTRFADAAYQILPCMTYMPNIPIADFLKFLRNREHLAMDFDLLSGELRVETFKTIKESPDVVDLTGYISTDGEQEVPAQRSFTVTLKSDEHDGQFADGDEGYPPVFTLVAGEGETKQELDCSTTKQKVETDGRRYPWVNQTVFNRFAFVGGLPDDMAYTDENDPTTLNNWPLRLIDYAGYLSTTPGNHFPCADPHDLNDDDAAWYRFVNDSKRIKPIAHLPAVKLAQLRSTDKFTHKTKGGNYVTYIAEQIAYDAGSDADLIPVKITARTINYRDSTRVEIIPAKPKPSFEAPFNIGTVKAYFDPALHGIKQLDVVPYAANGDGYVIDTIAVPTNYRGAGGVSSAITLTQEFITNEDPIELRIYQGQPKYLLYQGLRTDFAKVDNYYTVTIDVWGNQENIRDNYTIYF